jgi:hypothetical protein
MKIDRGHSTAADHDALRNIVAASDENADACTDGGASED